MLSLVNSFHHPKVIFYFRIIYCSQRDSDQKNSEDVLFDMFRSSTSDTLPVGKFLAALRTSGIRMNDPRIQGTQFVTDLYNPLTFIFFVKK